MKNYQQSSTGSSNQDDSTDSDKILQLTIFAVDICQGMLFLDKQSVRYSFISFYEYINTALKRTTTPPTLTPPNEIKTHYVPSALQKRIHAKKVGPNILPPYSVRLYLTKFG